MKKLSILSAIIILFLLSQVKAQVRFNIEVMSMSNIKSENNDNIFIEGKENGPLIVLDCLIKNEGKDDIKLLLSKSSTNLLFNYKGDNFKIELKSLSFDLRDSVILKCNENLNLYFQSYFLLGTSLWKEEKQDYTDNLLEILPTIRVQYKDCIQNIYTTQISEVKIED
jgi:hypothetical protein